MSLDFIDSLLGSRLDSIISSLRKNLSLINVGRPNPDIIGSIRLECCGSYSQINYLASIKVVGNSIVVTPYDRGTIKIISDAIAKSNLGLNPMDDGAAIKVIFPPLSEERRNELVKIIEKRGEETKITIRNLRRVVKDEIKRQDENLSQDIEKRYNDDLQRIIDEAIDQVDSIIAEKSKNIMTV